MVPTATPVVTTVIPAHQAARFIARALDSALAQEVPEQEIIVVDDGSTDGTDDVVRRYAAHGVRLIRHRTVRGASAARNTGIEAARGTYVAFLDADDEWLPTKLARQLALIEGNPNMVFVACRAHLIDEDGIDCGDIYHGAIPAEGPEAWRTLLRYPCVATPSVLVRRDAVNALGGFNPWLPVAEDQDMWIRLALRGTVGYVHEPLIRVHSMPNSLSKANIRRQSEVLLPMILGHVHRNRDRLTQAEIRGIIGARFGKAGRLAYAAGEEWYGVRALARAMANGDQPLAHAFFLVRASAPLRAAKRAVNQVIARAKQPRASRSGRAQGAAHHPREGGLKSLWAHGQEPKRHLARPRRDGVHEGRRS